MTGQSYHKPTSKPLGDTLLGLFFWGGPPQGPGEATLRQHRTARCTSSAPRSRHCVGAAIAPPLHPQIQSWGPQRCRGFARRPASREGARIGGCGGRSDLLPWPPLLNTEAGGERGGEVTESHDVYTESESTPSSPSPTEPGQY